MVESKRKEPAWSIEVRLRLMLNIKHQLANELVLPYSESTEYEELVVAFDNVIRTEAKCLAKYLGERR